LKRNDFNSYRVYHGILIERLTKAQNQWFKMDAYFERILWLMIKWNFYAASPVS
jgi:hypothetical protein